MNTPSSITESIRSSLLGAHERLFSWAERNPILFKGAGASMLLAPLFLKNDERGYVNTALLTTPIITAMSLVAPKMFPSFIKEGNKVIDFAADIPVNYGFNNASGASIVTETGEINIDALIQAKKEGRIDPHTYNRQYMKWLSDAPLRETTKREIEQEYKAAHRGFTKLYSNTSKQRLLSNALFHTDLKYSSAADKGILASSGLSNIAPDYSLLAGQANIDANKGNANWLREFNYRLRQAKEAKIISPGTTLESNTVLGSPVRSKVISYEQGFSQLKTNNPEIAGLLNQGVTRGQFKGNIEFITHPGLYSPTGADLEDLEKFAGGKTDFYHTNKRTWRGPKSNQPFDPIIGIRFNKDLTIPIPQADHSVYLGNNLLQKGVSRKVIEEISAGKFRSMSSPEYLLRSLFSQGINVAKERVGSVNHWLGRDTVLPGFMSPGEAIRDADSVATAVKNQQGLMSELSDAFINSKGETVSWSQLEKKSTDVETKLRQLGREGYIRSSGGTALNIMETPESYTQATMGVTPGTTEDLRNKALKSGNHTIVSPGREALLVNDAIDVPRVMMEHYMVPQAQAAFFSELPTWDVLSKGFSTQLRGKDRLTALNSALDTMGVRKRLITHMAADAGVDLVTGEQMFNQFLPVLSKRKSYEALRKLNTLGDVSRVVSEDFGGTFFENVGITLHETHLTPGMVGQGLPQDSLLGFKFGTPRTAEGETNTLTAVIKNELTGETDVNYTRTSNTLNVKGIDDVKWTVGATTTNKQGTNLRKGLNSYNNAIGRGGVIPESTNAYVLEQKGLLAAKNPIEASINQAGRTLQRLQTANEGVLPEFITEKYLPKLQELGVNYNPDEQIIHMNPNMYPETDMLRKRNMVEVNDTIRQMFKDVGDRIRAGKIKADSFQRSWLSVLTKNPNMSFQEYASSYNYTTSTALVESLGFNHATRVKFTHDIASSLNDMGLHGIAKEIQNRSTVEGNLSQSTEYLKHTDSSLIAPVEKTGSYSYDFSKPFGEVVNLEDISGDLDESLTTPEGRSGTIFDPDRMKENYSVRIKTSDGDKFIPNIGHDAYKGGVNEYGITSYATSEAESGWRKALTTAVEGGDWQSAATEYTNKMRSSLGLGKGSVYRPDLYDPAAIGGRITPRASTWRHEVGIGDRHLAELPRAARENLLSGGHEYGILQRYPVAKSGVVRVVYDSGLNNTYKIGVSLEDQLNQFGDPDGDPIQLHLIQEQKHKNLIKKYIEDPNSEQSVYTAERRANLGSEGEIIPPEGGEYRRYSPTPEAIASKIEKIRAVDPVEAMISRSSGSGVGVSSNLRTSMEALLEETTAIPNEAKSRMKSSLFLSLDQAAIYRQKRVGGKTFGISEFMGESSKLRKSLRNKLGANDFISTMRSGIVSSFGEASPILEHFNSLENEFRQLHTANFERGTSSVTEAARLLQMSGTKRDNYVGPITSVMENHFPAQNAMANRGAKIAAETAGEINSGIRETTRKVGNAASGFTDSAFRSAENVIREGRGKGVGKVLGIGLGVAAGAGLLFSSLHSPREGSFIPPVPSGNSHRPEERLGTDGEIPGEPVRGSMSPSNPPRVVHQPNRGINTAVVVPMGRDSDLEMTLKSDSRERSAEVAKMASRLAAQGGASNTNINYRDSTRLKSLRTRQKIRDAMDEN